MAVIFDTPALGGGGVRFDSPTYTAPSGPPAALFVAIRLLFERRKRMSQLLRQNTVGQEVWVGPFYSLTDGTLITSGTPSVTISKNGATFAAVTGTVGAIGSNGRAKVTLASADVDTLKFLDMQSTATGAIAVPQEFTVVSQAVYDQTYGATAAPTLAEIADAVHDEVVDGTRTFRESTRLQNASAAGKLSGAGSGTEIIRNPDDTKNRIQATVDAAGNRTAVSYPDLT